MKLILNLLFLSSLISGSIRAETLQVKSFYGNYDVTQKQPGVASPSLAGPIIEEWHAPTLAPSDVNIAVLFPHLKDPFWVAVNYGIWHEAKRLGVGIHLQHAGGYRNLGKQVKQLESVLANDSIDGVIIGAVQYKKRKLEDIYQKFHQKGIPIVSVINDSYTPTIQAKAVVSWRDLGFQAGKYLVEHSGEKKIKVAVFPGPKGSGWAPDSYDGFLQAIEESGSKHRIEIMKPIWGDTGDKAQRHQVNFILKRNENIDYIVGNALAAAAAVTQGPNGEPAGIDKYQQSHPGLQVISTYIIQGVYDLIEQKKILASSTDLMKDQGIMAVDMMVRILNGEIPGSRGISFPFRSGPIVPIITQSNIHQWAYEKLFGSRDFEAIFDLSPSNAVSQ